MISESLLILDCDHKSIKRGTMISWFYRCDKCKELMRVKRQYCLEDNGVMIIV